MLVNGKVWPFLDVEPRLYRLRILNGCNARILSLHIGGPRFWQIGAEGGMWEVPVPMSRMVLAPGRAGRRARRLHQVRVEHEDNDLMRPFTVEP
jgi:FtsP/CotA-like multicopper oxidase with cupredoxin domain